MSDYNTTIRKAIIYARVSDVTQKERGDGLKSQEAICREYANFKNLEIVQVFSEDISGKFVKRNEFDRMLKFVRSIRKEHPVVIIDDISWLARDVTTHWELRYKISDAGGELQSPSFNFEENADGRLIENVLAGAAQHQREKNTEQTRKRMRGRMMNGYWCFHAPVGYRYDKQPVHGKILARDEPHASILQEAFEGSASGRFGSQAEVKRFLEAQPDFPKCFPDGTMRASKVAYILNNSLYGGIIDVPKWDI